MLWITRYTTNPEIARSIPRFSGLSAPSPYDIIFGGTLSTNTLTHSFRTLKTVLLLSSAASIFCCIDHPPPSAKPHENVLIWKQ